MYLENLSKFSSYTTRLTINKNVFLHIVPDFNIDITDSLLNLNIGLNNCQAVYVKTKTMKFGTKMINPRSYFYKLKEKEDSPMAFLQTLPTKLGQNRFVIVDHTPTSEALVQMESINSNYKFLLNLLFKNLKDEFLALKSKFPNVENVLIFDLNMVENGMFQLLQNCRLIQDSSIFKCFDNYCIGAVSPESGKTTFVPLMTYDEKGEIELVLPNFRKVGKLIENNIIEIPPVVSNAVTSPTDSKQQELKDKLTDQIAQTIVQKAEKDQDEQIYRPSIELDKQKLSKTLKNYQVKDPVVANNIKVAIDQYLSANPKEIKKNDLETLILKSIHFSLFGTEEVRDEYVAEPQKLIAKLAEMNSTVKIITYPEPVHNLQAVSVGDVADIHKITGVGRHNYELKENLNFAVNTLFKSIETRKTNPIKVLKIKSELKDNNLDRIKEYTITVKNTNGYKEPYELKLRLPALVNDYYYKLNGQHYIQSSQQYLKPLTKDKASEVRFLSQYNMVTLSSKNTRFNTSQIEDILNYIRVKYSQATTEITTNPETGGVSKIEFKDGATIDLNSSTPFKSKTKEIVFEDGDYKLHDLENDQYLDLHVPKNEYIFHELISQIQKVNPSEKLTTTSKSVPFIQAHMMGRQLPLIFFFWQQLGLIETLTKFGIDFDIGVKPINPNPDLELSLADNKSLFIYAKTKRQELIINGLTQLPKGFNIPSTELGDRHSLDEYLNTKYGSRTTFVFDLMMENIIDPTTKELLEFEDLPTDFINMLSGPMMDKLLNDQPDHPADLKNLRLRVSEVLTNLLYSELCQALNKYNTDLANGVTDAKLYFQPDYILMNLLGKHAHSLASSEGSGVIDYSVTFSPVDELVKASKLIKTGPGGIPSKRAFRKEHRAIHPSYIGNIASHSISEYANAGIVNTLTLGASIANNYGSFGGKRANFTEDNVDSMSIDEYLIPLNIAAS